MTLQRRLVLPALLGAALGFGAEAASPAASSVKPHPTVAAAPKPAAKTATAGGLASIGGASPTKGTAAIGGSAGKR